MRRRNRKMTAAEKKAAVWRFDGEVRPVGGDRVWVRQRDLKTGKCRFLTESTSGRSIIRYGSMAI